jgi:DNA-binding response OmpR family regulator
MKKILIFDDRPALRELLAERLTVEGHVTIIIGREESVLRCVERFEPDLAILGLYSRGLLGNLKCQYPALPILLMPSFRHLVSPRFKGTDARPQTSFPIEEFALRVRTLLERPKEDPGSFPPILAGDSNQIAPPDSFRSVAVPLAH